MTASSKKEFKGNKTMEIHLTPSDLVTIINPHISHSDSGLKLNIMNGHAIKVFYPDEISDISIVDK